MSTFHKRRGKQDKPKASANFHQESSANSFATTTPRPRPDHALSFGTVATGNATITEIQKTIVRPSYTNLSLRKWSVDSYDTCGEDSRRTYDDFQTELAKAPYKDQIRNKLTAIGHSVMRYNTLLIFKDSTIPEDDITGNEIPPHYESDYEDNEEGVSVEEAYQRRNKMVNSRRNMAYMGYSSQSGVNAFGNPKLSM